MPELHTRPWSVNFLFGFEKRKSGTLRMSAETSTVNSNYYYYLGFSGGNNGKESTCKCRRLKRHGFSPWARKIPGGGQANPLQYSCLGIPWTEKSGRLRSRGSQRVRHDWSDLACTVTYWDHKKLYSSKCVLHFTYIIQNPQNNARRLSVWAPYTDQEIEI